MALGKAFIEVHADTRPFARELATELNRIIRAAERDVRLSANRLGQNIGNNVNQGFNRNNRLGNSVRQALNPNANASVLRRWSQGIIDALDDGLSGLPAEIKVALGAALVALLPVIGAAISAVVTTAVVGAFGALGFVIAAQFQVVEDAWGGVLATLMNVLNTSGSAFVQPVLNAFGLIQERAVKLESWFKEIFATAAQFVEPLTNALLNLVEGLLPGLLEALQNSTGILFELQTAFGNLGKVIGEALAVITSSDYGDDALRDLIFVLGAVILSAAWFLRVLTEIYGRLRDISLLLTGPSGWIDFFNEVAADKYAQGVTDAASANGLFKDSMYQLLAPTEAEAKALAEINSQISEYEKAALGRVNNQIAWQQAVDDFTASVRENGRTLKLTGQAGRDNANELINLAQVALKTRADTIALTGDTVLAQKAFLAQKQAIYDLAKQMRLSKTDTDKLIAGLLNIPPPVPSGVDAASVARLQRTLALINQIYSAKGFGAVFGALGSALRPQAHAKGGVFTQPHMGLVAEAGPEAIIPLNNPARASQVMAEAGLGGMAGTNVNVYIGNQQIDAYIDARVSRAYGGLSRGLAYGGRGI